MFKRLTALLVCAVMMFTLPGCSRMFETEYVSVNEYEPAVQTSSDDDEKVTVRNFARLKSAIRELVLSGDGEGSIVFDAAYDGDVVEDIASACWELRTEDAFCAYCVDNIAYDLTKIVSYYEATVYVSYSRSNLDNIVSMQYVTGAENAILEAFEMGRTKLVLLVSRSSYTADDMENIVADVYRRFPAIAPKMPSIEVNMFSGTGLQRLYEIDINYGVFATELKKRQNELMAITPFEDVDVSSMTELEKAYLACSYLIDNCEFDSESGNSDIYSALISKTADSEGMAYAYVELCRQLGVECQMIYGQRKWQDHCWNIVEIEDDFYHVDISVCSTAGVEAGFLMRDSGMWGDYRWDVSSYPKCEGVLSYEMISEKTEITE